MTFNIQHLFIYPVKSLGGIEVQSALLDSRGLRDDRRMMLVDEQGMFISQREDSRLALFRPSYERDDLIIHATRGLGDEKIVIHRNSHSGELLRVGIWSEMCDAMIVSKEANDYFSRLLERNVRLVYMHEDSKRLVNSKYNPGEVITAFTDGFPLLLIGSASLSNLNSRLKARNHPVGMTWDRFRPSVVIETNEPFIEDSWKGFRMGESLFEVVKPCSRCVVTTIDQNSGLKAKEPLKTLATFRTIDNEVMFGQNVVCNDIRGALNVGDEVFSVV